MAPSFQPLQDDLIVEWPLTLLSPCLSDHDYNIYAAHHRHNHNKLFPHSECSTREYCIPAEYCRQNPVRIYISNKNLHVLVKSRFYLVRGRREGGGWMETPTIRGQSFFLFSQARVTPALTSEKLNIPPYCQTLSSEFLECTSPP